MNAAPPSVPRPARRRGFTLVELIVASAVGTVLALLLVNLISSVLTAWNRTSGRLATNSQAAAILDTLTLDLQSAVFIRNGAAWFAASLNDPDNNLEVMPVEQLASADGWDTRPTAFVKPQRNLWGPYSESAGEPVLPIERAFFGQGGIYLRFFTHRPDYAGRSAPHAVAYQIVRRPEIGVRGASGAPLRYFLQRSATFATTYNPTPVPPSGEELTTIPTIGTFQIGFNLNLAGYTTGNDTFASPGSVFRAHQNDTIGNDVIDFGVHLWRLNGNTLTRLFPAPASPNDYNHIAGPDGFPDVVDLMVRVLTPEGARIIQAMEEGRVSRPSEFTTDGDWWRATALRHSFVYTRRIVLNQQVAP